MRISKNTGIICNKCRKPYTDPSTYITIKPMISVPAANYYTREIKYEENIHLCKSCYDEFADWLHQP